MKKFLAMLLVFSLLSILPACQKPEEEQVDLREKFPEYHDLTFFKGLEVYVWQEAEGVYRCGVLSGTNRMKMDFEIAVLTENGATVEEMKQILATYDMPSGYAVILPAKSPVPNYSYEIDDAYIQRIRALFAD